MQSAEQAFMNSAGGALQSQDLDVSQTYMVIQILA